MKSRDDVPRPRVSAPCETAAPKPALTFSQLIGQIEAIQRLKAFAELHTRNQAVIGHVLLVGQEGVGKRTIAHALAREYGVNLTERDAALVDRAGDLAATVNDLELGDILLLTNAHRLKVGIQPILAQALRDFELNVVVGRGPGMRDMRLAVKPFTCVATVPQKSDCPPDLSSAFFLTLKFQPYSENELQRLAETFAANEGFSIEMAAATLIGRIGGSPGQIETLVRKLRLAGKAHVTESDAAETLSVLGFQVKAPAGHIENVTDLEKLSGVAFEGAVAVLLEKMGFHVSLTRASGDGGIDIEAIMDRAIVGGRYLIQCKRFAPDNLVGSATVREFYGALVADRRAVKGILITTSGFTQQAREFANGLPIELIDSEKLEALLKQTNG